MEQVWRDKGTSNIDFFRTCSFFRENNAELVDLVSYPKVCFGVMRRTDGKQCAVLIEHAWNPHSWAYYNYGFAVLEEGDLSTWTKQRYWYRCPGRILEQLSPAEELYQDRELVASKAWRERCREWQQEMQEKPKPKAGQRIVFDQPIHFSDGEALGEFIYAGRNRFQHPFLPNWYCRIPHWRERAYQIVEEAENKGSALERLLG